MSSPLVAVIFGSGPRVGQAVAQKFKAEGFKVALGSRNPDVAAAEKAGFYAFKVDLADPSNVEQAFAQVEKELGPAAVVVYNAASFTPAPGGPTDPLSVPPSALVRDANITSNSAYAVAHYAVKGFRKLPAEVGKTFIVTGNVLPFAPKPFFTTLGYGKASIAHVVNLSAQAYEKEGFRFYFASQVNDDGTLAGQALDGPTHGEVYLKLYKQKEQGNWDVRFVKGGALHN